MTDPKVYGALATIVNLTEQASTDLNLSPAESEQAKRLCDHIRTSLKSEAFPLRVALAGVFGMSVEILCAIDDLSTVDAFAYYNAASQRAGYALTEMMINRNRLADLEPVGRA